jgi:hypothetical protein
MSTIKALEKEVTELDRLVADANVERKAQYNEFIELMASTKAAKDVLQFAKDRLNKFYNPTDGKQSSSFEQRVMLLQASGRRDDPEPPPAFRPNSYDNNANSNRVTNMIDILIGDLTKEIVVAQKDEETAQRDYEAALVHYTSS